MKPEDLTMPDVDRRFVPFDDVELRMEGDETTGRKLKGYAVRFGQRSEDLGGFFEEIDPQAFAVALPQSDLRALFNHNPSMVLGRQKAGTLRVSTDERGLAYEIDLPNTTLGRDLAESIKRGDIDGSSFSFKVPKDGSGERWERRNGKLYRVVTQVAWMGDVGPVTFPAYTSTKVSVRCLDKVKEEETPEPIAYERMRQAVDVEMAQ